jgi:hypothetical protein
MVSFGTEFEVVLRSPSFQNLLIEGTDMIALHQRNVALANPALDFALRQIQRTGDLFNTQFHGPNPTAIV